MKVTNVSATKGETGQISVSWNAAVGVDGYNVYRYTEGFEDKIEQVEYVDTNSYVDTEVEFGTKYYYSVKPVYRETIGGGSFNPSASTVNHFGKTEAGNLGYVYCDIIDFTVEESFASDTKLNPYFTIKFKMDEINNVYTIVASNDKTGITVKLDELTNRDSSVWTNGLAENAVGYKALNTETLEATVNADIGVVDNFDTYAVSSFTVTAMKDDGSMYKSEENTKNEAHYKDLGVYDYLYIVNTALSQELTIANSSKHFNGDWWGTSDFNGDSKTYNGNGITIISCYSSGWSSKMNPGSIDLNEYKTNGLSLNTENVLSVMSIEQGVMEGGFQGNDPLNRIGDDSNNRTVSITVEKTNSIDGKTISYDNASISYNDVYVDGSAGTYTVTIGGTAYDPIAQTDAKLIKKVELNN